MGGPLALKYSEIVAWLDLNEVYDGDTRREFVIGVQSLDTAWLNYRHAQQQEREKEEAQKRGRR